MFSLEFTKKIPFEIIYLHGMVRNEGGHKLSKSKGFMMDPLIVMDELGTDALRFTLLVGSTPGNDTIVNMKKIESNRNFANKIWNAGRFVISAIQYAAEKPMDKLPQTLADQWILSRLNQLILSVERLFANFQYGEAGKQIYEFFWAEFADWYLEIAKLQLNGSKERARQTAEILAHVMDVSLRLLHPFTPYVTEELWAHLKTASLEKGFNPFGKNQVWEDALIIASWPVAEPTLPNDESINRDFKILMEIIREIRNLRADKKVTPGKKIQAIFVTAEKLALLESQQGMLCALAYLDPETVLFYPALKTKPDKVVSLIVSGIEIHFPLSGMVDSKAENARLEKELKEAESQVERLTKLLSGDFARKAPPALVEKEKQRLETYKETISKIKAQLK